MAPRAGFHYRVFFHLLGFPVGGSKVSPSFGSFTEFYRVFECTEFHETKFPFGPTKSGSTPYACNEILGRKKHSIESYRVGTVWTGLYRVAPWGNGFWPGSNKMESGRPIKSFGEATARSRIGPKKKRKEKFPRRSSGPLAASRACSVSSFLFVPDFFCCFVRFF